METGQVPGQSQEASGPHLLVGIGTHTRLLMQAAGQKQFIT